MKKDSKIYVAGHSGLVGSAIVRELKRKGYTNVVGYRVDLTNRLPTWELFSKELPEYVFNAAAHAGGIMEAIEKPAEMLIDNLFIQAHLTEACKEFGVKKFLNIGSSCIYPVDGEQPYREEQLGTGKTDENWSYAVAKLAGIELCRAYHKQYGCNFMTAIPCNMYGPNDNFGDNGHVIPMLIRKFYEDSQPIEIWGDGKAYREFLYVDDFAECAVILMEKYEYNDLVDGVINIGSGRQVSIDALAKMIGKLILNGDYEYYYTTNKPSGVVSKLMDISEWKELSKETNHWDYVYKDSWEPKTSLERGIRQTYEWYLDEWYLKNSASNQPG